ncbi:MAG: hypothetical protein ACE5I1_07695 [bacterium]
MSYDWRIKARLEVRKIWAIIRKDKYDKIAAELTDLLLQNWSKATKDAMRNVIRAVKGKEKFTDQQKDNMLVNLRLLLSTRFQNDVAAPLLEIHTNTYAQGMKDVVKVQPTFQLIDNKAITAIQRHNIFWVGSFWDNQLGGQVAQLGTQVLEQGLNRDDAGKLFEKTFADRFNIFGQRYWGGFANHAVTRARELGAVEGYVRAQVEEIVFVAVMDRRTSSICRSMNGRIIKVSEAVELRNKLIDAENPEDVKQIAPWLKPEAVDGKKSGRLHNGLSLPPLHFRCRSRTIKRTKIAAKNQVTETDFGKGITKEHKKALKGFSADEWSNYLQEIRGRRRIRYNEENLEPDFMKHGKAFGFPDTEAYINAARKAIRESDKITVHFFKGNKQFTFFGNDGMAIVDEEMDIRGFFEHPKKGGVEKAFEAMKAKRLWLKLKDNN